MQEAYAIAKAHMKKSAKRGQKNYNRRVWSSTLKPGDHVLVRNLTPRGGPGKLRNFWEDTIYVVSERKSPDSPVYVVKPLHKEGRERVLHRNLLLPCPYLLEESEAGEPNLKEKSNNGKPKRLTRHQVTRDIYQTDSDSSSEDEYHMLTTARPNDSFLNADAEEFHPKDDMIVERLEEIQMPENNHEKEQEEEGTPAAEGVEAVDGESDDMQEDEEDVRTGRKRSTRVRQPRKIYTYDQLGQPTLQPLKSFSSSVRGSSQANCDPSIRPSPRMYPFYESK